MLRHCPAVERDRVGELALIDAGVVPHPQLGSVSRRREPDGVLRADDVGAAGTDLNVEHDQVLIL